MFVQLKFSSLLLVFTVFFSGYLFANEKLKLMTENWPPLNYMEGEILKGPAVDIVRAIQKKLKSKDKIEVFPWKRGYLNVQKEKGSALFAMTRTDARESLFKWVGPIAEKKFILFAKKDSKIKLNNIKDALKYSVGVQLGGVTEEFLKSKGFTKISGVVKPEQNLKKLLLGRIELLYDSNSTLAVTAKKNNTNLSELKELLVVKKSGLYIAFNKDTPDATVSVWQKAYESMYNNGTIKKIFEKNKNKSLYPSKLK